MLNTWGKSWKPFADIACTPTHQNAVLWKKKSSSLDSGSRYKGCSFEAKDEGCHGVGSSPRPKGGQIILGFANYYLRFVQGYAELASPLTYLTKKDSMDMGSPSMTGFPEVKRSFM